MGTSDENGNTGTTVAETKEDTPTSPTNGSVPIDQETSKDTKNGQKETKLETRENHTKYSLQLKSQYMLNERSETLPALRIEEFQADVKRQRGRNKKRPRDNRPDPSTKICFEYLKNKEKGCPYGDTCKYSHDVIKIFQTREKDIEVDHTVPCPRYNNYGYCPFSITCRVGGEHLDEVGNNLRKEGVMREKEEDYKNIATKDILMSMRKDTFPFKTPRVKRVNNRKKQKQKEKIMENVDDTSTPQPEAAPTAVDTPYPLKEVKLIDFRNKVYIAPLTTVGNLPFRRIMKHYQADITCSEMAVSTSLLSGVASEWALLKRHSSEDIYGIQIAAGHPNLYMRTCEILQHQRMENGFEFDFLDMNLGCPLDIICDKGAGAKLMTKSNKLRDIVIGMGKILVDVPVSIKMRTGWDEKKPFAKELIQKIIGWDVPNVSTFFVHGRSRLQRYTKLADWEYIESIAAANPSKPVIPNGDILSYTDYYDKLEKYPSLTPCAMLARGALIKPWLPLEIKKKDHYDISSSERFDMLKQFVSYGLEHWGSDTQGVNTTRRFLLEWLSFLYRYVPVGLLEVLPQGMNQRPPIHMCGRDDLETLMLSSHYQDWVKISEMLLGPVPDGFEFKPKHKANSYS